MGLYALSLVPFNNIFLQEWIVLNEKKGIQFLC